MRRYALLAAVLLAACKQDPPGGCQTSADCVFGRECSGGVCVVLETDHQLGSRCVRDSDCVSWADCVAGACALAADRCDTTADCAGWQLCGADHTCIAAAGHCGTAADCEVWEVCDAANTCQNGPGYCAANADCESWQQCSAVHACVTASGSCAADADCSAWEDCGADHRCALAPGRCASSADCSAWDVCDPAQHACVHGPGYCASNADCSPWEECGAAHACAAAPGFCSGAADCQVWEACNASHTCENGPAYCASSAECASWQQCSAVHACEAAPGYCGVPQDCAAWEACGTDHLCVTSPGHCASSADCETWQTCDATHACTLAAGRCATDADCAGWQTCDGSRTCAAFSATPDHAYYAGYLEADNGQGINGVECFADPYAPMRPFIALPENNGTSRCWIGPSGEIIYKRAVWNTGTFTWNYEIRQAVEDPLRWDNGWGFAAPVLDNDPLLLATPSMDEFVLQEGTGAILHDDSGSTWSDELGNVFATGVRVLAWNQAGAALAVRYPMTTSVPVLIEAGGAVTTTVTGIDLSNRFYLSARVHGSGFWLLVARTASPGMILERWTIAADATATLDGYFASAGPAAMLDIGLSEGVAALDGSGAAWALVKQDPISDSYVYRLELEPGVATRVVGDPPAGVNHNDKYPLNPFVVTGRSTVNCGIITGP